MPNRPCKVLTQLMVSLVVCLGLTAQSQGTVVMSLVPSAPPLAAIGDTISFNLSITGATDLYAFQFSLMFDPTVVTLASLVEGAALGTAGTTFFVPGAFDNISGLLELTGDSLIGAIPGFTGGGVFASIGFTAVGAGSSTVTLGDVLLLDSSLNGLASTADSATVRVAPAGGTAPEPTSYALVLSTLALMGLARRQPILIAWQNSRRRAA